jgi:hypothetical protein
MNKHSNLDKKTENKKISSKFDALAVAKESVKDTSLRLPLELQSDLTESLATNAQTS